MELSASLKTWFYTNGTSTVTVNSRIPILTSAGEPDGSTTIGDLAAVVGTAQMVSNGDCNNIREPGVYRLANYVTNQPFTYTTMVVYRRAGNDVSQVGFNADNSEVAYRVYNGSSWTTWTRLDNFGCDTPAELAALMGIQDSKLAVKPTSADYSLSTVILDNIATVSGQFGMFIFSSPWDYRTGGYRMILFMGRTTVSGSITDTPSKSGIIISKALGKCYMFDVDGSTVYLSEVGSLS